jgi:lipopolysaccharide transport system ATP-binding protein
MSDTAIRVDHIGKLYHIGRRQRHSTLRDVLAGWATAPIRRLRGESGVSRREVNDIWAIKDISFNVKHGEVVGLIGRNGAGKSTLLKILSRITEPTVGRAEIYGRVSSLLEVGTGFHPELTGRENVYLNGAILGMRRTEIARKFDEIVAFAEIEKFLDTPVKHYSSGMYVRLAFAVAAHLEPEILIVDEVLAVGDAAFQKKCLGMMSDVAQQGRTVFFVSHSMSSVSQLCSRALLLDRGEVVLDGPVGRSIEKYLVNDAQITGTWQAPTPDRAAGPIELIQARILRSSGEPQGVVGFQEGFQCAIEYKVHSTAPSWVLVFQVLDSNNQPVFTSWDTDSLNSKATELGYTYLAKCAVPGAILRPGIYSATLIVRSGNGQALDERENVFRFQISPAGYAFNEDRRGVITPMLAWENRRLGN